MPIDASKILLNDFEGGYNATKHLIESGKTNLIHLSGAEGLILSKQRKTWVYSSSSRFRYSSQQRKNITLWWW